MTVLFCLLKETISKREFEIFTAIDRKESTCPIYYSSKISDEDSALHRNQRGIFWSLSTINIEESGSPPNSLMYGKRLVELIETFIAIVLDLDSGKEGYDLALIEQGKQKNLTMLLDLQLPPNIIIEKKWFTTLLVSATGCDN